MVDSDASGNNLLELQTILKKKDGKRCIMKKPIVDGP